MKRSLILCAVFLSVTATADILSPVVVPKKLRQKLKSFEPSAGIYLPTMKKYLITSDDTTEKNNAWLFLMNESGEVDETPVRIKGLKQMTDIESLSQDDSGFIYALSSLGLNRNGKDKPERNLFVRSKLKSSNLELKDSVELRPLLVNALESSRDPILMKMRGQYEKFLDVESHFVKDGELYVGMKDPQPEDSHAVILNLGAVDAIFNGKVNPKVWRLINLSTSDGITNRLSEMAWRRNELWVTSTSDEGVGHLWNMQSVPIMNFSDANPEGLIFKNDGSALILFDQSTDGDGLFTAL